MMRLVYLLVSLIFFSPGALSQQHPPYPHWKVYRVKNGDWLYKISRELKTQNITVVSLEDLIQRILKRNPQLKNPNQIGPNQEILIPFSQKQTVRSISSKTKSSAQSQIIHNHYYYNPTIYQGDLSSNTAKEKSKRAIASFSPSLVLKGEQHSGNQKKFSITIEPFFQFSKLDAKEKTTGFQAQLVSEISAGIGLGLSHNIFESIDLQYFASYTSENFSKPLTSLPTANFQQNYLQLSIGGVWAINHKINIKPYLSYREKAYIQVETSGLSVGKVGHPLLGVDIDYKIYSLKKSSLIGMTHLSYFLSGSKGELKVEDGYSYGGGLGYNTFLWNQNLTAALWMRFHDSQTQNTNQKSNDLAMSFIWQTAF